MSTRTADLLDTSVKPDPFKPTVGDVYYSNSLADHSRVVVYAVGMGCVSVLQNGVEKFEAMTFAYFRRWLVSLNMAPAGKVREEAAQ